MNYFYRFLSIVLLHCRFSTACVHAQTDTTKPVKVAIFIPLYADDVFDWPQL